MTPADPSSRAALEESPTPGLSNGRSLASLFAAAVGLLAIAITWAVYDELETRRPWKSFQRGYRQARLEELSIAADAERERFASVARSPAYLALEERIAAEEVRLMRPAPRAKRARLATRIARADGETATLLSRLRPLRDKLAEMEWRDQKHHEECDPVQYEALARSVQDALERWRRAHDTSERLREELDASTASLARLQRERAAFRAPLERLERQIASTRAMEPMIRQIVLEGTGVVDRCISCHVAVDDPQMEAIRGPLGNHPGHYLEWHPPQRFGCTPCHRGQGRAVASVADAHADATHGLQPMLRGAHVQASCQKCHMRPREIEGAPMLAEGSRIYEEAGCNGCHEVAGLEYMRRIGPPLADIGRKTDFAWIVRWITKPRAVLPRTMMPNFQLAPDETAAIAAYLVSLAGPAPAPVAWEDFLTREESALTDEDLDRVEVLRERGRGVWGQARCSFCHAWKGKMGGFPIGPDLGRAGDKLKRDWLYRWVRRPRSYYADSRMPRFRIADGDLRAIVEFILRDPKFLSDIGEDEDPGARDEAVPVPADSETIAKGERLVRHYGCFGCHAIPGMETEQRVGPDISAFGSKPVEMLDFGRAIALPRTQAAWLRAKLSSPRGFASGLEMPSYDFTHQEIEAVVTLLLGFTDEVMPESFRAPPPPPDFSPGGPFGALLRDVNCMTCHRVHGTGSDIAPDLSAEGGRVKEDWLRRFLKQPVVIRPLLEQMPRFHLSDEEVEVAACYIESALWDDTPDLRDAEARDPELGKALFTERGCHACHQVGAVGGALGPNLSDVGRRLRPGLVRAYLREPGIYNNGAPEPDLGLEPATVAALASYLDSLGVEETR